MKLFIKILLPLFVLTLLFSGGLVLAATQQATPDYVSIYLPDPTCTAPCWNGINTDELGHADTVEAIMALPNAEALGLLRWQFALNGQPKSLVRLEDGRDLYINPQNIRLGDIIANLGIPDSQIQGTAYNSRIGAYGSYLQLFYDDYEFIVTIAFPFDSDQRIRPNLPIQQFIYPTTGPFEAHESAHAWQGFILRTSYDFNYAPSIGID